MNVTYLTVLSTKSYLQGVVILYMSLKRVSTKAFVVLCSEGLPEDVFNTLRKMKIPYIIAKDDVLPDYILDASEEERSFKFGDWGGTFFKMKMFELTQFDKICYLDADMIVMENIDELFDSPDMAAVPDRDFYQKETDDLNSGTLVFVPRANLRQQFLCLLEKMWNEGPYPFGDQNVVSRIYPNWIYENDKHLSIEYNAAVSRLHLYASDTKPKVLHYANHYKPWAMKYGYVARIGYCLLHRRFRTVKAILLAFRYNIVSSFAMRWNRG